MEPPAGGSSAAKNRAVLVVTHDARLLRFADRIVHIEDGSVVREEPADSNLYRLRSAS
jgi:putative ABC transport system ATP-binding protein